MAEPVDLTQLGPADRHRAVADGFAAVVAATSDWEAPTPVPEWVAGDVVDHLVVWFPEFLAAAGVELGGALPADAGPAARWDAHRNAVQALVDDSPADAELDHPMVGAQPLGQAVDRFYTADVFMHTWDLARAGGVDAQLDPRFAAELLAGMARGTP